MGFAQFMSSPSGRILRIVAGLLVILLGAVASGTAGWRVVFIVLGAVPLIAGAFDFCVFAPLFGGPFLGKDARKGGGANSPEKKEG